MDKILHLRQESFVKIGKYSSRNTKLDTGVPQGSILGPLLFTLYISPVSDIPKRHGLSCLLYADDSQIYLSFHHTQYRQSLDIIRSCLSDIKSWMSVNFLKLNRDKTEVLLLGSAYFLKRLSSISIPFCDVTVRSVDHVKNLGCVIDSQLKMDKFISEKCKNAMFYIKSIASIRRHLDITATKTLIQSLVISRLDYANSLLCGVSKLQLRRLQLIQNAAARLITNTKIYEHITPVLMELHWLPIEVRILFKTLVFCHGCVYGTAPSYLSKLVVLDQKPRRLRSSNASLLQVPRITNVYGQKAFSVAGPTYWNDLPPDLRCIHSVVVFKNI